ncbi:MAG: rod shape-determining protein MreD [Cellvibrionaceae bacterium]|nr:rod shape-determining protein MreD [Cellvibrionaceae bacterium]
MQAQRPRARWIIPLSYGLMLVLMVYPLPMGYRWLRPEFVALLSIYWVVRQPAQLGVGLAFGVGLLQDLVQGSVVGQHALALVMTIYVCQLLVQRLGNYGLLYQMLWIFALIVLHELFLLWISMLIGREVRMVYFWGPALMSALMWPLLSHLMDRIRWYWRMA